jgi:hypothetical protein
MRSRKRKRNSKHTYLPRRICQRWLNPYNRDGLIGEGEAIVYLALIMTHSRTNRLLIILIIVAACAAYLPTVMPDISASPHTYFTDVGNVQNALNVWGTLHSSGYPLFSFVGALFVTLLRAVGVVPAAAASLFSTLWAIAALVVLYLLIVTWLNDRVVAIIITATLGLGWAYWLFASYAEVYSLAYFVMAVALYAAVKADQTGQVRWLYVLAVCGGMSIAHHRAIALMAPALLVLTAPALWRTIRRQPLFAVKWIGFVLLVGVVPYAYIWLRAQQPGAWVWGDPTTLPGLWRQMLGETYLRMFVWPTTLGGWFDTLSVVMKIWFDLQTWPVVVLSLFSLIWMLWRRQFRYGAAFLLGALAPFVIAVADYTFFAPRRLPEDIPALLQMSTFFTLLALAFFLNDLRRYSPVLRRAGVVLMAVLGVYLAAQNLPSVYALTHDTTGRQIIADAQQFVAEGRFTAPPAFFSPWGGEFWALSYATQVTVELHDFQLLPNRADLKAVMRRYGRIDVFANTFYQWNLDWWRKQLGGRVYLSGSGPQTVALASQPLLSDQDLPGNNSTPIEMGDAPIMLRDWAVKPLADGSWQVALYWQAAAKPDRDFSVSVKATDRENIASPDDIVAQADASAPVHGWYPTSLWSPGEIVRDDYTLTPTPDRPPRQLEVSLYTQDGAGGFTNFGKQVIPLP